MLVYKKQALAEMPRPAEIRLLTTAEWENYHTLIPDGCDRKDICWYLMPQGEGLVPTCCFGRLNEIEPDREWLGLWEDAEGLGVRPALVYDEPLTDLGLEPGDKFCVRDVTFTVLSEKLAFADRAVGACLFSAEGNCDYAASDAKRLAERYLGMPGSGLWSDFE